MGRPECLLGNNVDEDSGGPFYMINLVKFIALLATFAALLLAQRVCWAKGEYHVRSRITERMALGRGGWAAARTDHDR